VSRKSDATARWRKAHPETCCLFRKRRNLVKSMAWKWMNQYHPELVAMFREQAAEQLHIKSLKELRNE
jgi:hypothetical protein